MEDCHAFAACTGFFEDAVFGGEESGGSAWKNVGQVDVLFEAGEHEGVVEEGPEDVPNGGERGVIWLDG